MNKLLVNLVGYGGAAVIYALLYARCSPPDAHAQWLTVLWVVHFTKRCLECLFVHRWRSNTVDELLLWLGEWIYYLGFAFWIGAENNACFSLAASLGVDLGVSHWLRSHAPLLLPVFGSLLFVAAVAGNFWAHLRLRNQIRSEIPRGGLFAFVSCPHYFCEVVTWFAFFLISQTLAAAVFFLATFVVLVIYSRERHLAYRQQFPRYPWLYHGRVHPGKDLRQIPQVWRNHPICPAAEC